MRFSFAIATLLGLIQLCDRASAKGDDPCGISNLRASRADVSFHVTCNYNRKFDNIPRIPICKDSVATVLPLVLSARDSNGRVYLSLNDDDKGTCVYGVTLAD